MKLLSSQEVIELKGCFSQLHITSEPCKAPLLINSYGTTILHGHAQKTYFCIHTFPYSNLGKTTNDA